MYNQTLTTGLNDKNIFRGEKISNVYQSISNSMLQKYYELLSVLFRLVLHLNGENELKNIPDSDISLF